MDKKYLLALDEGTTSARHTMMTRILCLTNPFVNPFTSVTSQHTYFFKTWC